MSDMFELDNKPKWVKHIDNDWRRNNLYQKEEDYATTKPLKR